MGEITIDKNQCIGCGTCVAIVPEVFELGDDGKARIKKEWKSGRVEEWKDKIKEAVDSCPVGAIKLTG